MSSTKAPEFPHANFGLTPVRASLESQPKRQPVPTTQNREPTTPSPHQPSTMNHPRRIPWSVATPEEVMTEYVGVKLRDYYFNPAVMMDVQLKSSEIMHELYGLPVRKSVGASFTSYICASALGLEVHFPEDNCPQWARHPMGRIDEVDGLAVPKDL
ncbi:MAG: hypothetical protein FJ279_11940, partial [Planctomycetes bacterium]|nr:hypothetical protein [Planctomycetota bacterium]